MNTWIASVLRLARRILLGPVPPAPPPTLDDAAIVRVTEQLLATLAGRATAAHGGPPEMTLQALERAKSLLDTLPAEPFAAYMRARGYDPDLGWGLLVPRTEATQHLPAEFWPHYVRVTGLVAEAVFVPRSSSQVFRSAPQPPES